jgi:DNA-directed RNA polymerase beta' subunit
MARRKAAQITRDKEKERERIDKEKVDTIRKLINKDPQEYNRQMKAHNLRIQRLAEAFLETTTTDKQTDTRTESMELSQSRSYPQKPRRARIVKSIA